MRNNLFFLPAMALVLFSCSTSKISIRKEAVKQLKTVAIMPFTSAVASEKVTRESSEMFRSGLIAAGIQVVEREKIDKLLKEKALAQTGLIDNKAIEAGQFLGAEGTMLGEITAHELKSHEATIELPDDGPHKYDARNDRGDGTYFQRNKKWFKKEKTDTFEFQIVVRLISNIDSQTILTLQNEYPVRTYTSADGNLRPVNLDQFRAQVLAQMSKDIEKALREARE